MINSVLSRIGRSSVLFCAVAAAAFGAGESVFRAGAAKVDITPAADAALPMSGYAGRTHGFTGIHDPIYVRAIAIDDGTTKAAIVAWELIGVPETVWAETSRRVAAETGIRPENLLLAAVHDHSAPSLSGSGPASPGTVEYTKKVEAAAVEAIRRAQARLQPARVGTGSGIANVNINRREWTPGRGWWLGHNENGPSDKTVAVLRFDDLSGKPIAFLINYAVHVVVMLQQNYQVSGDLAGATSRFVEQHYLGKDNPPVGADPRLAVLPEEKSNDVVAVWTSGAAGDQNPVVLSAGEDFMPVNVLGKILGEEVVRVAGGIKTSPEARIRGAQQVVTCPGRQVEPGRRPRLEYKFTGADPVSIRLSLMMIGNIAVTGVSGEVFNLVDQHLKRESPFNRTVMLTNANGSSGYIPDDAAFDQVSYEIITSRLKPGCAENAIVNGLVNLMNAPAAR